MLSEADKKWLEERKEKHFLCRNCTHSHVDKTHCQYVPPYYNQWCYLFAENQDWEDCAEFEARVAKRVLLLPPCAGIRECVEPNQKLTCEACRLKHARLAVEAEMEKEGKWL